MAAAEGRSSRCVLPKLRASRLLPDRLAPHMSLETVAALATVLGTAVSILALIQASGWLAVVSSGFICVAVGLWLWGRREKAVLNSALTVIEGHSIDSLNLANLRRKVNRTLYIQEAHHTARIKGEDMEITWRYTGFCRKDGVSSTEFSVNSDARLAFENMDCVAFDLSRDPEMKHPISPTLTGPDGISKKISVAFLEPLKANEPFGLLLSCKLPKCFKPGFGYYTSNLSFAQARINRCVVHLIFERSTPDWMRVYEGTYTRPVRLVKTLIPSSRETASCDYIDVADGRRGQSARLYVFWREHL